MWIQNWLTAFLLSLWLSPFAGVVLGMVYVNRWVAGHQGFLLQDFFLVTVAALGVAQVVAPVLVAVAFVALSLPVLAVAGFAYLAVRVVAPLAQAVALAALALGVLSVTALALVAVGALAAIAVPLVVAAEALAAAWLWVRTAAETLVGMVVYPRCLYCGHHHEKAMVWAPPHRWRVGGGPEGPA